MSPLFPKVREGYWFAPKCYGLGATPVTWQGWLALAVFAAMVFGTTWLGRHETPIWYALLIPLTLGFIALTLAKTDGGWRWRWGADQ